MARSASNGENVPQGKVELVQKQAHTYFMSPGSLESNPRGRSIFSVIFENLPVNANGIW